MSRESLYIIGNGFDIHHGVSSRYSDFKEYLPDVDSDLHDLIEELIPTRKDWSDLEASLADIDVDNVVDRASQFLASYGAEDWCDAYHHEYQYEVTRIINGLSVLLKKRFAEWVRQLEIPAINDLSVRPLRLPITARYLNFNYTSSLKDIYSIPSNQILYIHGKAQDDEELVLGHAWNPIDIQSLNDVPDPESMDARVIEGNEIINDYFGRTYKNSEKIITNNTGFFQSLASVSEITVLGHSLSQVDEAYLREIVRNIDANNVQWIVTYYRENERTTHQATLRKMGVPAESIVLCRMNEF